MHRWILVALCLATPIAARAADLNAAADAIHAALDRSEARGFSGVVLLTRGDERIVERASGLADREASTPNSTDTLFDCGSVAKQFVAAAILVLEQRGALTVDDPVARFFPSAPDDVAGVTIHQLLAHTSGMTQTSTLFQRLGVAPSDRAYLDALLRSMPRHAPPGSRHRYNNMGYCILAGIVEDAAGSPYEEAMAALVFEPAGLTQTACTGSAAIDRSACAVAYVDGRPPTPADALPTGWGHRGATGIVTSAEDLERWSRVLREGDLLSDASRRLLWRPAASGYALGWRSERVGPSYHHVRHGGSTIGFECHFGLHLHEGVTLVVWSNAERDVAQDLIRDVRTIVDDALRPVVHTPRTAIDVEPPSEQPTPASWRIDDALRAELVGRWRLDGGGLLILEDDGLGVSVRPEGLDACDLVYWRTGKSSLATWESSAARAREVVEALAARDVHAIAALLRGDEDGPSPDDLVERTHELAALGLELGLRVVGTTWDYGKNPIAFEASSPAGETLSFAVLWDPYTGRLVDVQTSDWRTCRPARFSPTRDGTFRLLTHAFDDAPLECAVDRGDDGSIEALRLVLAGHPVGRAHRVR